MASKDLIKAASLPERSISLCLDQGLQAQVEELDRRLDAPATDAPSMAGDPKTKIAQEIMALTALMGEHSITFRMRALPRRKFTALMASHPPREGNNGDRMLGFNEDTLFDALIRACVAAPDDLDEEDWAGLIGEDGVLSSAQYEQLSDAAWAVNRRDVDVPFSRAASLLQRTSEPE